MIHYSRYLIVRIIPSVASSVSEVQTLQLLVADNRNSEDPGRLAVGKDARPHHTSTVFPIDRTGLNQ